MSNVELNQPQKSTKATKVLCVCAFLWLDSFRHIIQHIFNGGTMRTFQAAVLSLIILGSAGTVLAQLLPPNASGVSMGHLHYKVRDVNANKKFWIALGAA